MLRPPAAHFGHLPAGCMQDLKFKFDFNTKAKPGWVEESCRLFLFRLENPVARQIWFTDITQVPTGPPPKALLMLPRVRIPSATPKTMKITSEKPVRQTRSFPAQLLQWSCVYTEKSARPNVDPNDVTSLCRSVLSLYFYLISVSKALTCLGDALSFPVSFTGKKLVADVQRAVAERQPVLDIPRGVYRLNEQPISIEGAENLTLRGPGVEIICEEGVAVNMRILWNKNIAIEGATVIHAKLRISNHRLESWSSFSDLVNLNMDMGFDTRPHIQAVILAKLSHVEIQKAGIV